MRVLVVMLGLCFVLGCTEQGEEKVSEFSIVTYNAALLPWDGQEYVGERIPEIAEALNALNADVICLQEVWDDSYFTQILDGMGQDYVHYFQARTVDPSPEQNPEIHCEDQEALEALVDCYDTQCAPSNIPTYNCTQTVCNDLYVELSDKCIYCIMTNPDWGSAACVLGGATDYVYGGRNGLGFISKMPLTETTYTPYASALANRGVLSATVGGRRVHCTHLAAPEYENIPYAESGMPYGSFHEEQMGSAELMLSLTDPERCEMIVGDLNSGRSFGASGPAYYQETIDLLETAGFENKWDTPECTWCNANTLVRHGEDAWIDHVLVRGCGDESLTFTRVLDEEVQIRSVTDGWVYSSLSDHYGVMVEIISSP